MPRPTEQFWAGFFVGILAVAVVIGAWIGWAAWTVNTRLDQQILERDERLARDLDLPIPELKPLSPRETVSYDWTVQNLDGETVPMDTFRDQTILLSFWGTWCAPCRAEMPSLARLAEQIEGRDDLALVLVSNEDPERVRKYAATQSSHLSFYVTEEIPSMFYPSVWPTASVIGCDGTLIARHVGGADWSDEGVAVFLTAQAEATCS